MTLFNLSFRDSFGKDTASGIASKDVREEKDLSLSLQVDRFSLGIHFCSHKRPLLLLPVELAALHLDKAADAK